MGSGQQGSWDRCISTTNNGISDRHSCPLPAYSIILSEEDRSLDHCPHMSLSLVEAPNDPIKHPLEVGNVKCLTAEVYGEFNSSVIVTSRQYTARNSLTDG